MTIHENKSKLNMTCTLNFLHHLFIYVNVDYDIEEGKLVPYLESRFTSPTNSKSGAHIHLIEYCKHHKNI